MTYSKSPELTTDLLDRSFPRSFRPLSSSYHDLIPNIQTLPSKLIITQVWSTQGKGNESILG